MTFVKSPAEQVKQGMADGSQLEEVISEIAQPYYKTR